MSGDLKPGCFGWSAFHARLPPEKRLAKPCPRCPFVVDFLARGRLDDLKFSLSMGQPFWCHVTVYAPSVAEVVDPETGEETRPDFDPGYRMCEGAARWLDAQIAAQEPKP